MNIETVRTHTITLNDRERDLLTTIINRATQRHINSSKTEEDTFADELLNYLQNNGGRFILNPDEATYATIITK